MAGKNRRELAQTLKHYSRDAGDSLKLRAAEFLIANMPGKYSEYRDAAWNDIATVCMRWTSSSDKQHVLEAYNLGAPIRRYDIHHITSEYLIDNIELAFREWQNKPWCKNVAFSTFLEEILPYRIGTEPLENWRAKALASFADVNRAFINTPNTTALEACGRVNALLPKFHIDPDFPDMCYTQLMTTPRGTCTHLAALAAFTMRAMGIPVTLDYTPQWLNQNRGHTWNSVCDSAGRHIAFMGTEASPGQHHQGNTLTKAKAYRKTFAIQRRSPTTTDSTPPELRRTDFIDISHEHPECIDIQVAVRVPPQNGNEQIWLAEMGAMRWNVVAAGQLADSVATFSKVGKNCLYLPVYYRNRQLEPANAPFQLTADGTVNFIHPTSDFWDGSYLPDTAWLLQLKPTPLKEVPAKGLWRFDSPTDLGKAIIGRPLELNGPDIHPIQGENAGDGAIRIGRGSFLKCWHGISANGGGERVNNFTIKTRVRIQGGMTQAIFQTNTANSDHPETIITDTQTFGLVCYSTIPLRAGVWHELLISSGPERYSFFIDGRLVNEINKPVDDRFSLSPDAVIFFGDDGSFDNEIDVTEVAIWDTQLF
jgi:hypothetical protein